MTVDSKVKQTLVALKGCQATLRIYGKQSKSDEIKKVFMDAASTTEEIVTSLENRVQTLEFQEPQYQGH